MTFQADLRRELAARGIRGRLAARIDSELADHLACDPAARLGAPAEIAERFAIELRVGRTRRASLGALAALALTAFLVVALARRGGGSPFAGLGIAAFAQIALVAASLALLRAFRRSAAGDLRLAQRRGLVALAAGVGVCACVAFDAGPLGLVPLPFLVAAAWVTRGACALTPATQGGGLDADLGPHARQILAVLGLGVVAVVVAQGVFFERSASEGLTRGLLEAAGLAAGVALLGRPLGLRVSA
jgi:hypothetical protein